MPPKPLAIALASLLSLPALAGPLLPPAGPVAPTMKTLVEVEPRTAINSVNTPGDSESMFRITAPGSYYLPANITIESQGPRIVLTVEASGVTVDLNGFTIKAAPGSGVEYLIIAHNSHRLALRNGVLTGGTSAAVSTNDNSLVENLSVDDGGVINPAAQGIMAFNGAIVRNCIVRGFTTAIGVQNNCIVESCTVRTAGSIGISASRSIVRDSAVYFTPGGIFASDGSKVSGNLVRGGGSGITLGQSTRAEDNTVVGAASHGFRSLHASSIAIRNNASQCAAPFAASGAKWGPTATDPATATSPWANFSH